MNAIRRVVSERVMMAVLAISCITSATWQVGVFADHESPRGFTDVHSYVSMFQRDYHVAEIHRYRPLVPEAARAVHDQIERLFASPKRAVMFSFFLVNALFMIAAAWLLADACRKLGVPLGGQALAIALFSTSQVVAYVTALPLADSPFLFAVSVVAWCIATKSVLLLTVLCPLLVLTKETTLAFLFLPLVGREFRRWPYLLGLLLSFAALAGFRLAIDHLVPGGPAGEGTATLVEVIMHHMSQLGENTRGLLSKNGAVFVYEAFGLIPVFSLAGWLRLRRRDGAVHDSVPLAWLMMIPLAVFFALLSNNYGRLLFCAFPPVILLAVVALTRCGLAPSNRGPTPLTSPEP